MALHEIIRRYPGHNSGTYKYTPASAPAPYGLALMNKTTDATLLIEATGSFLGFLTRNVTTAGPGLLEAFDVLTTDSSNPTALENVFKAGDEVSVEKADAVEAEGSQFLLASGTGGGINLYTAVGSELSFVDGKFRVAQSGDTAYFTLACHLTPDVAGNVRIRAEAIR